MAFTIKCNECGNEQVFKEGDRRWQDNIEIEAEQIGYQNAISHLTIYCENEKCNHWIDIKY
ncbi:hypothetical protein [Bacillus litorisediminis]|uniref:hypothetical protein n=1 Tax=Bacillus litorisediminis TaxID=2922713 RepID=UPI001FAE639D|nr:hypothetical protein [Bacillus litorisediminis]